MNVRKVIASDEPAIWAMLEPVFRAGDTYAINPEISQEDALAYWMGHFCYVAVSGDDLVGTFYIRPNQQGGGAHVCNCGYITARGQEGKGVARTMLEFSLIEAKRLGFEAMQYNFVLATNTRAIDTWKRAGFSQIGQIPRAFRFADGVFTDALILHRYL